jgi:eukaryotic-like serine/threonine-protein kinase
VSAAKAARFGCPKCLSVFRSGFPRCPLDGSVLQTLDDDPLIGFVLAERYVIEALIGEGGMGRVYRARHIRMSRRFAIKVLFGDLAADGKARSRFSREAESSSRLSHPNVVSVIDFGETDEGLLYLVMDFIEGEELHRVVGKQAPFSTARSLSLLRQLARGLGHAHDRGLVHRDFKTENILITTDAGEEIARIVDFGIAVLGEMTAPEQRLTTEGMVLGTPAYMSPEQSTGEEIDHRADLFSLGVMLYEMLAGKLPFDGSPIAMAKANLAARVPPIAERVPGVRADRRLEAIAMRLMAKEPEKRFSSASALLAHLDTVFGRAADTEPPPVAMAELAEAAEGDAAPVRTMSEEFFARADEIEVEGLPGQPTRETGPIARAERRRWIIAGAVALTALLVTGGALYAHYRNRPDRPVAEATPSAPEQPASTTPAPAATAPDAGAASTPTAVTPAADAAPVPVAAREATPSSPTGSRKPPRDRGKKIPAAGKETTPAPPQVVSQSDFDRRYRQVGALLDKLTVQKGDAVADPLSKKYFSIPYADAIRSDSVRRDADRALRTLASRIATELKK